MKCYDIIQTEGPVAQRIRHLTTDQGIPGSNPGRVVFFFVFFGSFFFWLFFFLCYKTE